MNLSVFKDENLQGWEKAIFTMFSVMQVFQHNVAWPKLNYDYLNHVNNVIFAYAIF